MRTFIFSYIISMIPLLYVFYPTFQVEPLEAVSRVCFYFGFPMALVVSFIIIVAQHFLGHDKNSAVIHSSMHQAADDSSLLSKLKVS